MQKLFCTVLILSLLFTNTAGAAATVTCTKLQLFAALMGNPVEGVRIEGDATVLKRLIQYATVFTKNFNIIEP